jgi:hypothetical protein
MKRKLMQVCSQLKRKLQVYEVSMLHQETAMKKEKEPKRQRKKGNKEGLMERYLDMRTKQADDDSMRLHN